MQAASHFKIMMHYRLTLLFPLAQTSVGGNKYTVL